MLRGWGQWIALESFLSTPPLGESPGSPSWSSEGMAFFLYGSGLFVLERSGVDEKRPPPPQSTDTWFDAFL